jgi:glycosyltransferase involved in cell wall biosynthesis
MPVSVVMSVYNERAYIGEAIESVLRQSYRDFEFIIIDDGSTDGTGEIVDRFAASDPRIKVVRNRHNKGMPITLLNEAIFLAQNELIARFDSDDVMVPIRLERQVAFMNAHPNVSVAGSYSHLIDSRGRIIGRTMPEVDADRARATGKSSFLVEMVHPTVMMRRAHFAAVGGYRPFPVLEDRDLWGRFVTRGYKLAVQEEFLLLNRRHSGNISQEQYNVGWQIGNLINENISRRLRGLSELDMPEYEATRGFLWRVNDHRQRVSTLYFRKAVLSFASSDWLRLLPSLALAVALSPIYISVRAARKILLRQVAGRRSEGAAGQL